MKSDYLTRQAIKKTLVRAAVWTLGVLVFAVYLRTAGAPAEGQAWYLTAASYIVIVALFFCLMFWVLRPLDKHVKQLEEDRGSRE